MWLGLVPDQDTKALRKSGVNMYGRHHALRDCLYEAARAAYLSPWKEVAVDHSGKRPTDVFLPSWSRGRPLAIDVTVTHFSQTATTLSAEEGNSASVRAALDKVRVKEICTKSNVCDRG